MANWSTLKEAVASVIKTNSNQEITGQILQDVLLSIITNVGENATFAGIANLNTNPGAPDGPVFYLATTAGTYPNFNGTEVQDGEAVILQWNNSAWTKKVTGFATQEKLSQLGSEVGVNSKEYAIRKELSIEFLLNPTTRINLSIKTDASTGVFLYIRKDGESSYQIYNNYKVYATNTLHEIELDAAIDGIKVFFAAPTTSEGTAIISISSGLKLVVDSTKERMDEIAPKVISIEPKVNEIETTYNPKAISKSKAINNIIQEIYLVGTDESKEYEIRSMLVYGSRKTFVIGEVGGDNVAQMDSPLSDAGVVNIFALNNSGITGYVICNFPTELNFQPFKALNKWVYTSLSQNPSISVYLRKTKDVIDVASVVEYGLVGGSKGGFNDDFRMITNLLESETDGILTKIKMLSNSTGTAYFAIGFVDQNGKAILNDVFSLPVVNGNNDIDVTNLGIRLNKGDVLFGLPYYIGGDSSVFTFESKTTDTNNDARLYFATSIGGKLFSYQSIGGGEFSHANLSWEIKNVKSPFAEKNEVKELANEVTNTSVIASKALSNSFKVKDRQGNTYKMVVVDGNISLIPQQFKNIAVVGNSITLHGRSDAVNWLTSGYGMAASTPDTDFSAFILEACKSLDSSSALTRKNLAHWEISLNLSDSIKSEVQTLVSGKDLVIIKIGENVSSAATNFSSAFAELIDYIISVNSNAEIVVCSLFWSDAAKDKVMRDVAMSKNLVYCTGAMTDSEQMEAIGHYLKSSDGSYFEVTNYGVQRHPSDIGMLMIANSILAALNMETLEKLHSINVESNGIEVECYTKGVENGIVTISANLAPTIKTTSGVTISKTSVADGKWVFTMPNEDVNVSFYPYN